MLNVIMIPVSILLHIVIFLSLGFLLEYFLKLETTSCFRTMIFGYVLYFAIFECLALPMTLLLVSLSTFTKIMAILLTALILLSLIGRRADWKKHLFHSPGLSWNETIWISLVILCIAFQIITAVLYQDTSADGAYYVGTVSTSVYTDTLGRFNPYTGAPLKVFPSRYIFSCYPMHNAFMAKLLHLHPIIQSKTVMTAIHVCMANLLYYQMGLLLFSKKKKQASLFVLFIFLLNIMTGTLYTPGTFLYTRAYEGKALLANFSIFFVLYCCIWLYQEKKAYVPWILLFLGSLCAITFSGSALYLPAVICAGVLPALWKRKNPWLFVPLVLSLLPNILYTLAYFAAKAGILTFTA
ncbi:MAG: DUF6077 domain-containing protein [Blautia sp.]